MRRSPPLHLPFKLLLALALICACVTGARAQFTNAAQQPRMPGVIGLSSEQAEGRLRQFGVSVSTRDVPSTQPQGTVVSQSPDSGTVIRQGTVATLGVSTGQAREQGGQPDGGSRLRTVPDLRGLNRTGVLIALIAVGLAPGAVDSQTVEGARGGRVVAQDPEAGARVARGTRVSVTLARHAAAPLQPDPQPDTQPQPPRRDVVTVPDLRNLTPEQARARIGRARLLLGAVGGDTAGNTAPGTVFAQRPAAGESVEPGSFVTITLTQARPAPLPVMPQLVGRPIAEARRVLAAAGVRAGGVREREEQGDAGRVLTQSIPAGTRVRPGATVDLIVSRAPVVVTRPDTLVATRPDTPPRRDTASAARQDTLTATQTTQRTDSAAPRRADSVATPARTVVTTRPAGTTTAPSADVDRPAPRAAQPTGGGWPREATWALIALLVAVAGAAIWRIARRGPPPAQEPVAVTPVPPVAGSARLKVAAGGWESASEGAGPVSRGKVRLNVRIADPRTVAEAEAGGAALQPSRVVVRTADAGVPVVTTDGAALVDGGAAVQVRVREGAPEFTADGHTPLINGRR